MEGDNGQEEGDMGFILPKKEETRKENVNDLLEELSQAKRENNTGKVEEVKQRLDRLLGYSSLRFYTEDNVSKLSWGEPKNYKNWLIKVKGNHSFSDWYTVVKEDWDGTNKGRWIYCYPASTMESGAIKQAVKDDRFSKYDLFHIDWTPLRQIDLDAEKEKFQNRNITATQIMKSNEFTINCTGDVVAGDIIRFTEAVFSGSYKNPKYVGDRVIEANVLKESYGEEKQQHTFTLEITNSSGINPISSGEIIRRKGRNIYRNGTERQEWEDESLRHEVADEKHQRGDFARSVRRERKEQANNFVNFSSSQKLSWDSGKDSYKIGRCYNL
jgi:hypothetical protein